MEAMTTLEKAHEILAAGEKATPRPWEAWNDMIHTGPICSADGTPTDILATCIKDNDQDERDAEYIALTANHSPDLAREVIRLSDENTALQDKYKTASSAWHEARLEITRLRDGYLADENGNEYVAVCILKEKINELKARNAELHRELQAAEAFVVDGAGKLNARIRELEKEIEGATKEIENAPVVYCRKTENLWACDQSEAFARITHTARLIRIKPIKGK